MDVVDDLEVGDIVVPVDDSLLAHLTGHLTQEPELKPHSLLSDMNLNKIY